MNLPDKITGNTYTAAEFTQFKNEVQNMILASGLSLASNSVQLKQAVSRACANAGSYTENGAANAYNLIAIGTNDKVSAYQDGQIFAFVTTNTNTGASTLAIDGLAAKALKKDGFANALDAGDIVAGRLFMAYYDSGNDAFELLDVTQAKGILKNNFAAIVNPTISNDSSEGYAVGSQWINTSTGAVFEAVDVSVGAAVWVLLGVKESGTVKEMSAVIFYDDTTTKRFSDSVNNTEPAADSLGNGNTVADIIPINLGTVNFTRLEYRLTGQSNNDRFCHIIDIDWDAGTYAGTFSRTETGGGVIATVTGSLTGSDSVFTVIAGANSGTGTFQIEGHTDGSGNRIIDALPKIQDHGEGQGLLEANHYILRSN